VVSLSTSGPSELDVLFIVDNSGSMAEEQVYLINSFPNLFQVITDITSDYHIGVVTTDTDATGAGRLRTSASGDRWVDPADPNPLTLLSELTNVGTNGSATERGLRSASLAMSPALTSGYNSGFFRPGATLALVVLSDEDDFSSPNPTAAQFVANLQAGWPATNQVSFSSIVGPVGGCSTAAATGAQYLAVTNAVGGTALSICATDYSTALDHLYGTIASFLDLSQPPVAASVVIERILPGGARIPLVQGVDYTLSGTSVVLGAALSGVALDLAVSYVPAR